MPQSTITRTPTPDSSQLIGYGYDPATRRLAVQFKSTAGTVYEYKDFPPELAAAMDAAESKGSFIYRQVKGKFDFDRMPEDETAG